MHDGLAVIERLRRVTDAHDVDTIVDCFTDDYVNETPAHTARGFVGRDQVRANWSRIRARSMSCRPRCHTRRPTAI